MYNSNNGHTIATSNGELIGSNQEPCIDDLPLSAEDKAALAGMEAATKAKEMSSICGDDEERQMLVLGACMHDPVFCDFGCKVFGERPFMLTIDNLAWKYISDAYKSTGGLPDKLMLKAHLTKDVEKDDEKIRILARISTVYEYYVPGIYSRQLLRQEIALQAKLQEYKIITKTFFDTVNAKKIDWSLVEGLPARLAQIDNAVGGTDQFAGYDLIEFIEAGKKEKPPFIVPNMLQLGRSLLLAGKKKIGKSTTLYSLIPALCDGGLWLDTIKVEQTAVVYLDWEDPIDYASENLEQYLSAVSPENRHNFWAPKNVPAVLTASYLDSVVNHVFPGRNVVVIANSAVPALGGMHPDTANWDNFAAPVRAACDPLTKWCHDTKTNSLILVQHQNQAGRTGGSEHWEAAFDIICDFEKTSETRRMLRTRGRVLSPEKPLYFGKRDTKIFLDTRKDGDDSASIDETTDRQMILGLVPVSEGESVMTEAEVREQTGWSEGKTAQTLKSMAEAHELVRRKDGKRFVYWKSKLLS